VCVCVCVESFTNFKTWSFSFHWWRSLSSSPANPSLWCQPFFFSFSSTLLSWNPLTALEFPRMLQLGTCLSRGTLSTPTSVESWWRCLSARRTQSAAGAPVRSLMTCVSPNLRRGGCHNRFTLAAWSGEIPLCFAPICHWDLCLPKLPFLLSLCMKEIMSWCWRGLVVTLIVVVLLIRSMIC